MNKKIIYSIVAFCLFALTACSDSIDDTTSKHVYSEDENPYLKVDQDAIVTNSFEFPVGHFETQTIKLSDYEQTFKDNMGMTVDEVLAGLEKGTVVFYNINITKGRWNKAEMTKGTTGWFYNTAGGICSATDTTRTVSIDIDKNAKSLIVNATEKAKAGSLVTCNVGFALVGPDYDYYVRFEVKSKITDPSLIIEEITIPAGDYNSYAIDFTKYESVIQTCMGLSVTDFLNSIDSNGERNIHMYMINPKTDVWDVTSQYTANPPGYWMTDQGAVCNWNDKGFTMFAEANIKEEKLYVGRAPSIASGSQYKISIGYRDTKDEKYFFRFIITVNMK